MSNRDPAWARILVLGVVFAASSVYLALKIGLTVSASIPIAVLAVAFFRTLGRSTILENNIVQTTGSAGESIAAGVVFTLPAILLMGYDLSIAKVGIIAAVGGILGILLMIPLRRALIVKEHKTLTYPEGTACAEVLIAGEKGGLQARLLFQAFGLAFVYKFLMAGLKMWKEVATRSFGFFSGGTVSAEVSRKNSSRIAAARSGGRRRTAAMKVAAESASPVPRIAATTADGFASAHTTRATVRS